MFMSIFIWLELPHTVVARGSHTARLGHHTPAKDPPHVGQGFVLPHLPTPHKNPPCLLEPPEVKALASDRAVVKEPRVKSCHEAVTVTWPGAGKRTERGQDGHGVLLNERGTSQSKSPMGV